MNSTLSTQLLAVVGIMAVGLSLSACNTTKATMDTTVKFFSSTSPEDLLSSDGIVMKDRKINLFVGVAYENLRQESAAGGGQYVTSLATLYQISTERQQDFAQLLQSKHADLFVSELNEDRAAHLKMVNALNRELMGSLISIR
jgi:DUF3015 family protein